MCCVRLVLFFFFFKQKTVYEMLRSLVGSEMCIRDSRTQSEGSRPIEAAASISARGWGFTSFCSSLLHVCCLLYTSDAADDLLCVDLGGRRIIKKKK